MRNNSNFIADLYLESLFFNELKIDELFLQESKLKDISDKTQKNLKTVKKILSDFGVDTGSVISSIKGKVSKTLKSEFKKGSSPEKVSAEVLKIIIDPIEKLVLNSKVSLKIKNFVEKSSDNNEEIDIETKIWKSLLIFYCVLITSSFILAIFGRNSQTAMNIYSISLGPIIEEASKNFALRDKYPFFYTATFAGLEGIQYLVMGFMGGANIPRFFLMRLLTAGMHISTVAVQKYFFDKFESEKVRFIGFVLGVLIHVLYNFFGLKYNSEIRAYAGL